MVKPLDFSTLMASSVHDLKNVIAAMGQAYESLHARMPAELRESADARLIEQESRRLDGMLMQLLGLYKLEHGQLLLQPAYCRLDELFEDLLNRHRELLDYRQIEVEVRLPEPDLEGFLDSSLIGTLLDNALGNALNHCQRRICLQARREDDGVLISVSDDGAGYSAGRLLQARSLATGMDRDSGSTGLGLYFAGQIVALHDQPAHPARLQLSNSGELPGACLQIWLPFPCLF